MKNRKGKIIPLHKPQLDVPFIAEITKQNLKKITQELAELNNMFDAHYQNATIDDKEEE